MRIILAVSSLMTAVFIAAGIAVSAPAASHGDGVRGVDEVKVYFDVNVGDPALLLKRLKLIERTIDDLVESGVSVTAVAGFRGGASRYVTVEDYYVIEDEVDIKEQIQTHIKMLADAGLSLEQCRIAATAREIEVADALPEIEIVTNGYVAMIGYQAQGYAVVPMD
ncbi:MAG: DsrE family protein [Desulfofustis sp. PB-SRB1]|nr:DsrE family protein [Desulfofustis sp. PB-SRB1]